MSRYPIIGKQRNGREAGYEEKPLARKLGLAPHISFLRKKAERLRLPDPDDWIALAAHRGCLHYTNYHEITPVSETVFSNEELSALLLSSGNIHEPILIRAAAQLLSDPKTDLPRLVRFCEMEHALLTLAWIAKAGAQTEPENPLWQTLLAEIPEKERNRQPPVAVFPHPSRFRVETGFQRCAPVKAIRKVWLRPTPR